MFSANVGAWEMIVLSLLILCLGGLLTVRHILGQSSSSPVGFGAFGHIHERVESLILEFRKELALYHQRCDLLDVYTPEYFNTFQAAGWNELRQILTDLDHADHVLDSLLESGEVQEAEALVNMLMGRLPLDEVRRAAHRFQSLAHLTDWRKETAHRVIHLVEAIESAANETKDLGINRKRHRKPTLLAIDELHSLLPK